MRRHPYSVVLLDEVEKAHPDVWNVFLQILDEGKVTDSKGRVVNMKNTIIIMTSNIGSHMILETTDVSEQQAKIRSELLKYFRPEFLNRIDDTVIFEPLNNEEIIQIATLMLEGVKKQLLVQDIRISFSEKLLQKIAIV